MVALSTQQFYGRAQSDFLDWCNFNRVRQPASLETVARYLDFVLRNHGARATVMRASAIGHYYRARGRSFDIKHPSIQEVLGKARRKIPRTQDRP